MLVLDLYIFQLSLQIGFRGLNLEAAAGVALTVAMVTHSCLALALHFLLTWNG
jgi:hypothetical protein